MTVKKFFLITFFQWVLLTFLKLLYFKDLLLVQGAWASTVFILAIAIISIALVRRLGVLNFLEAIFVLFFWFLLDLFLDLILTNLFTGISIFFKWQLWIGYLVLMFCVFVFHKKHHIHLRKERAGHY